MQKGMVTASLRPSWNFLSECDENLCQNSLHTKILTVDLQDMKHERYPLNHNVWYYENINKKTNYFTREW
jgi:alpha-galactosidase/6-phospho-beta-glucosidase family protein